MSLMDEMKKEKDRPVVIANHLGVITHVNQKFTEVFQWEYKEIVGKPITTIIPKDLHDSHHLGFSRFLVTEESKILNYPLNLKAVKKDQTIFLAEHLICAAKENGEWIFAATIRPRKEK